MKRAVFPILKLSHSCLKYFFHQDITFYFGRLDRFLNKIILLVTYQGGLPFHSMTPKRPLIFMTLKRHLTLYLQEFQNYKIGPQ